MGAFFNNGEQYGGTATTASQVMYNTTESVADKIEELSNRTFTQTQILNTTITTAQDVTIPNFSDYDFVQVIIQGDNNNGISVFVPTVMFSIPTPFALYAINNGETFGSYSIHANGMIHNGTVKFNYLNMGTFNRCTIRAYGIKLE